MAYQENGLRGLLFRDGTSTKSLARATRADLQADPTDVDGIRAIVDQILVSELHVGIGNTLTFMDEAGSSMGSADATGWNFINDVVVGGDLTVAGNAFVAGTKLQVDATISLFHDNIIVLSSGPSGSYDSGFLSERFYSDWGVADVSDTARANGGSKLTLKLAAGDTAATNDYVGYSIAITGGTGAGQQRTVTANDATTKLLTPDSDFTVAPDATSTYSLYATPNRFAGLIYDQSAGMFKLGHSSADPGAGNVVFTALDDLGVYAMSVGSTLGVTGQADFTSNLDASGGVDIDADNQSFTLGAGADLTMVHNGTNTVITSITGDLQFVNTSGTGYFAFKLGTADANTAFSVQTNAGAHLFDVQGGGRIVTKGGAQLGPTGGDYSIFGGMGGGALLLGANNEEIVRVVYSAGGGIPRAFLPVSDSSVNLGSTSYAFATAYVDTLTSLTANDRIKLGTDAQVCAQLPVFATTELTNIAAPAEGDFLYDSTDHVVKVYNGSSWASPSVDTTGIPSTTSSSWTVFYGNTGATDVDASLVLLSGDGSTNVDTGTLTYVFGGDGADLGVWTFGASVQVDKDLRVDGKVLAKVAGGANSATNTPNTAGQAVYLTSDGLSQANAATEATCMSFLGAYSGTAGVVVEGGVVIMPKLHTNAGMSTFEPMTRGQVVFLVAALADEYDTGVTPIIGTVSLQSPKTSGAVLMKVGIVDADSADSVDSVNVKIKQQYIYTI